MSDNIYDFRSAKVKDRLMSMDYEELNRHLSEVSDLPDFAQKDGYICLIWEVMEEKDPNPCNFSDEDIQLSWEAFCEKCREEEDLTIIDDMPESLPFSASSEKKPKKKTFTRILRGVAIAAAIAALLCGVAAAFGVNVFERFIHWGDGTVQFFPGAESSAESASPSLSEMASVPAFKELRDKLMEQTDLPLVPQTDPKDSSLESLHIQKDGEAFSVNASYIFDEGCIYFEYSFFSTYEELFLSVHQANNSSLSTYLLNDRVYYFIVNNDQQKVIWFENNIECQIWGNFTEEDAKELVNSIQ